MPYFLSTADLITGNCYLDSEHGKLITLIDAVIAACESGASSGTVHLHFEHLMHFARAHFEREDREMCRLAYGGRDAHVRDHARLLQDLATLELKLDTGQPRDCAPTYQFMRTWLREHILHFDIPMVASKDFAFGTPGAAP